MSARSIRHALIAVCSEITPEAGIMVLCALRGGERILGPAASLVRAQSESEA
jgi:hypothetical protein